MCIRDRFDIVPSFGVSDANALFEKSGEESAAMNANKIVVNFVNFIPILSNRILKKASIST